MKIKSNKSVLNADNSMDIEKFNGKKLNIYGTEFTIQIVDEIKDKDTDSKESQDGYFLGMTYYIDSRICVARTCRGDKVDKNEMLKTLCHEVIHAILGTGSYLSYNNDEPMVEFLGRGMLSFIEQLVLCK